MREKILKNLANWHASHPWRMALVVLILTVIFVAFASQLSITMRTSDLLPERDPKVIQFNKIIDEFATATSLIVVIQGEEKRIKEFADKLAPKEHTHHETMKQPYIPMKQRLFDQHAIENAEHGSNHRAQECIEYG